MRRIRCAEPRARRPQRRTHGSGHFPGRGSGPRRPASALAPRARAGAGAGAVAQRALDDVELSTIARALFFDDAALFAVAPPAAASTPAEALGHVEATPRSPFRPDLAAADDDARARLDRDETDDLLRSMGAAKDEATAAARRHASTARAAARMIAAADAGYALPPCSSPEKLPRRRLAPPNARSPRDERTPPPCRISPRVRSPRVEARVFAGHEAPLDR